MVIEVSNWSAALSRWVSSCVPSGSEFTFTTTTLCFLLSSERQVSHRRDGSRSLLPRRFVFNNEHAFTRHEEAMLKGDASEEAGWNIVVGGRDEALHVGDADPLSNVGEEGGLTAEASVAPEPTTARQPAPPAASNPESVAAPPPAAPPPAAPPPAAPPPAAPPPRHRRPRRRRPRHRPPSAAIATASSFHVGNTTPAGASSAAASPVVAGTADPAANSAAAASSGTKRAKVVRRPSDR